VPRRDLLSQHGDSGVTHGEGVASGPLERHRAAADAEPTGADEGDIRLAGAADAVEDLMASEGS